MNNTTETQSATLITACQFIMQASDTELDKILEVFNDRRKMLRMRQAADAKIKFSLGDTVMLRGLSPKYLDGTKVTIIGSAEKSFLVKLEPGASRRVVDRVGGAAFKVPASCVMEVA